MMLKVAINPILYQKIVLYQDITKDLSMIYPAVSIQSIRFREDIRTNLQTYLTKFSSLIIYGSVLLTLALIGRDGRLSTLCHSCRFDYQQRVPKAFPVSGYPRSENEVV